jgi:prepilin-type N-terminal cleavage/methylation domain-containing protein
MKNKRVNNKGFSLVELIVVIAIMAILAVTLAPKLMHYVDKARLASDQEVDNAVYNAVRLAYMDESLATAFQSVAGQITSNGLTTGGTLDYYYLDMDYFYNYNSTSKKWEVDTTYTTGTSKNAFCKEIADIIGNFKFKSEDATLNTDTVICYNTTLDVFTVITDYSGLSITEAQPSAPAGTLSTAFASLISSSDYTVTE